jgi:hypothetical protein
LLAPQFARLIGVPECSLHFSVVVASGNHRDGRIQGDKTFFQRDHESLFPLTQKCQDAVNIRRREAFFFDYVLRRIPLLLQLPAHAVPVG